MALILLRAYSRCWQCQVPIPLVIISRYINWNSNWWQLHASLCLKVFCFCFFDNRTPICPYKWQTRTAVELTPYYLTND